MDSSLGKQTIEVAAKKRREALAKRTSVAKPRTLAEYYAEMKERGLVPTFRLTHKRGVDKYDPCPCGSGKKYKFCCWRGAKK